MSKELPTGKFFHLMYDDCKTKLTIEDGKLFFLDKDCKKEVRGIIYCKIAVKRKNKLGFLPFLPTRVSLPFH